MRVSFSIHCKIEGELGEVLAAKAPKAPSLEELLATMDRLAFTVETVAHLKGMERELLPLAETARDQIKQLQARTLVPPPAFNPPIPLPPHLQAPGAQRE